jgi:hypothetical protein
MKIKRQLKKAIHAIHSYETSKSGENVKIQQGSTKQNENSSLLSEKSIHNLKKSNPEIHPMPGNAKLLENSVKINIDDQANHSHPKKKIQ